MYRCHYPGCKFLTNERSEIDVHHILPRSLGGSNKPYNLIELCPNHHRCIYHPLVENGIHSKKIKGSIIIINTYESSQGKVLYYLNCDNNIEYGFFYETGYIMEWCVWSSAKI